MSNNEQKEKISLENFNYEAKGHRLTSPFSIKACKLQGVTEEDLYHLKLEDYILLNPESKYLPKELQKERYDNYEENRTKLIESLKEARNKLKEESEKEKEEKEKEEKEKEKNEKEEVNNEDDKNNPSVDKRGKPIKNKENVKRYKKLKDDMEFPSLQGALLPPQLPLGFPCRMEV